MYPTVELAEIAFYQAFEDASVEAMMAVWSGTAEISCIHPTGPVLAGVDAIRASWQQIFAGGSGVKVQVNVLREYASTTQVVHLVEEHLSVTGNTAQQGHVLATNVYQLEGDSWRMVSHHGAPAPRPQPTGKAPTLH
ncbi:MAG TPA: nuclear transport factor 2 family protein [Sulfuriferula sp.]|nr:nuclear transport factor 2 family protein [Sulfuriferula sp.]